MIFYELVKLSYSIHFVHEFSLEDYSVTLKMALKTTLRPWKWPWKPLYDPEWPWKLTFYDPETTQKSWWTWVVTLLKNRHKIMTLNNLKYQLFKTLKTLREIYWPWRDPELNCCIVKLYVILPKTNELVGRWPATSVFK